MGIAEIVLTTAALLIVVASVQPLARRSGLPFTVVLALAGVAIGLAAAWLQSHRVADQVSQVASAVIDIPVSSSLFLTVLLPILLFQGAVTIDARRLMQDIAPVILLAVLAVIVALGIIGGAVWLVAPMPLAVCLLFGAIVATTDPSAVIALFRDLGAPARLTRLVEGESLLNDATAIAAFSAFLAVVITGQDLDFWMVSENIVVGLLGGALAGLLAGRAAAWMLEQLRFYRAAQLTIAVALPYAVYVISDHYIGVSGVTAVVISGLVLSAVGRSRFQAETFRFFEETLEQLAFWATSLIFLLAALLAPRLLADVTLLDLLYLLVAVVAALAARAVILFGIFPLLSLARVTQKVTTQTKTVIIWGGLRGSVTLALVLAVSENFLVDPEVKRFIAIQATGFALFTLLVQGTTLSTLMRRLGLDQLSPIDRAFRSQVLQQSLSSVGSSLRSFAGRYELEDELVDQAIRPYNERLSRVAEDDSFAEAISDRDRLTVGLIALANQEKSLLLQQGWSGGLRSALVDRYLLSVESMIDAVRSDGRLGYLRAARRPYRQSRWFRFIAWLHFRCGVNRPLAIYLGQRFQFLLINRIIILELIYFLEFRLAGLLGDRLTEVLGEIVNLRLEEVERHLIALRLQYPNYARELDHEVLERYAYREELEQVAQLRDAGIIGEDLARDLRVEAGSVHASSRRSAKVDFKATTPELLHAFPVFAALSEADLERVAKKLQTRVVADDAHVFRRGDPGDGMYFIASGAVEIRIGEEQHRLGRGDFFGEMAMLDQRRRSAEVRSISYSHLLFLPRAAFDEISVLVPEWRSQLAEVAAARRRMNEGEKEESAEKPAEDPPKETPEELREAQPEEIDGDAGEESPAPVLKLQGLLKNRDGDG
ncbi:cyclic nucleotide-binding domain-containing protein [Pelagibius litoralis]|uniref:Cyclic nucleotide-binding domain-containing protein n=1 Tax=Pelagibius litoralis TaxID=374515 RepID=A0A967C4J0_9PROT|nr:cation:proton antiporter [Pelagibius litoralis]NIA68514.1 cyclic nucleotide-binding domain-containing protein [Pelagibius litoralis]